MRWRLISTVAYFATRVRDATEPDGTGGLDIDPAEVLAALGERSLKSNWRARDLEYIAKDEQDVAPMHAMAQGGAVNRRVRGDN